MCHLPSHNPFMSSNVLLWCRNHFFFPLVVWNKGYTERLADISFMSSLISKFPLSLFPPPPFQNICWRNQLSYLVSHSLHFASLCYSLGSSLVLYISWKLESRGLITFRLFVLFCVTTLYVLVCSFIKRLTVPAWPSFVLLAAMEFPFRSYLSGLLNIFILLITPTLKIFFYLLWYHFPCLSPTSDRSSLYFVAFFYSVDFKCCNSSRERSSSLTLYSLLDFIHCPTFEYCIYDHSFPIFPDTSSLNFSP